MSDRAQELAVVSYGSVLPGTGDRDFFENLLAGKSLIRDLRSATDNAGRMRPSVVYSQDRTASDHTYSAMGSAIDRVVIRALSEKHRLPLGEYLTLEIMVIEAIDQVIAGTLPAAARGQTDLLLGTCNTFFYDTAPYMKEICEEIVRGEMESGEIADVAAFLEEELGRLQPFSPKEQYPCSQRMERIRTHFGIGGYCAILDAACASSLSALTLGAYRLRQGLCRYALVGGMDNNLGSTELLASFSTLGVLSEEIPRPLDHRSTGLVVGEGAVMFLLTSVAEARRAGLPILAIIKGIGGASDGRQSSLTEPSAEGQILSYQRAYPSSPKNMAYVECHGTGTKVGDRVEIESLTRFFSKANFPVGTVKYNYGHTMGAAGALGLLKCINILRQKMIPPAPYFEGFPGGLRTHLTVNKAPQPIGRGSLPVDIGLSAFGFGGTNFHVWLQEFLAERDQPEETSRAENKSGYDDEIILCAEAEGEISELDQLAHFSKLRLPPSSVPFTDKAQLLSMYLVEKMLKISHVDPTRIDTDTVHVLSGIAQPLTMQAGKFNRHLTIYLFALLEKQFPELCASLQLKKERMLENYVNPNEMTFVGSMNSLVGSRVSKAFGFRGMHFTIDGDHAAGHLALEAARNVLLESPGAAVVLSGKKHFDEKTGLYKNVGMKCALLASASFAQKYELPMKLVVTPLTIERDNHAS